MDPIQETFILPPVEVKATGAEEYVLGDVVYREAPLESGEETKEEVKDVSQWKMTKNVDNKEALAAIMQGEGITDSLPLLPLQDIKKETKNVDNKEALAEIMQGEGIIDSLPLLPLQDIKKEEPDFDDDKDFLMKLVDDYKSAGFPKQSNLEEGENIKVDIKKEAVESRITEDVKPRFMLVHQDVDECILPDLPDFTVKTFVEAQSSSLKIPDFAMALRSNNYKNEEKKKSSCKNNGSAESDKCDAINKKSCIKKESHKRKNCSKRKYNKVNEDKQRSTLKKFKDTQRSRLGFLDIQKKEACRQQQRPTYSTIISYSEGYFKRKTQDHTNISHRNQGSDESDKLRTNNSFKQDKPIIEKTHLPSSSIKKNTESNNCRDISQLIERPTEHTEVTGKHKDSNQNYENFVEGSDFRDGVSSGGSREDNRFSESHTDSILCQCLHCQQKFEGRNVRMEIEINPYKNKFACELCGKKFERPQKLKLHKNSKCGTLKLFSCSICCRGYSTNFHLQKHIDSNHRNKNVKKYFKCSRCDAIFDSKKLLMEHRQFIHHINSKVSRTCDICFKSYTCLKGVLQHKRLQHSENVFECAHCRNLYKNKELLTVHIKKKHMPEIFTPHVCSPFFLNKKPSKYSSNKFTCEFCGKCFKNKPVFENHMLIHSGKKPFVCETCGKSFRTQSNLSQHAVIHSDKRLFTCDLCEKSFRIRNHLCQHMAVHGMVNTSRKSK